ncbi:ATP-binding protein [Rhodococcus sp. NPDC127528]|uniref:ATP-binding protein n=1 Tax=unclassified Rhodococcus (in: high G+C Gram-positive bacteria) TaxID=192944 RepID=UPI003634C22E
MPSAARERVGNLPHELTNFVGRRRELAEVRRLLSESRLVTLTGMGGVGKTRLALRAAANLQQAFEDGVWLVELGGLRDPAFVADTVAAALGLRERIGRPAQVLLADFLADRHLLLVLDNCEHLVHEVATLAESLLRAAAGLRILATSREALAAGGEAVLRVPPLTVPDSDRDSTLRGLPRYDAVKLFTQRACAVVPGFGLTEENKVAVTRICQRLEGLPLPIELAAARLRALSAEQLLQRLTDRYRLLTTGNRVAPSRQQTLRLCIDWSHDLLDDRERTLWRRLGVFAGGIELDAAAEVCGSDFADDELVDVLASLVDKSILIREETGEVVRYRLLETLREYGREKLQEAGEYPDMRRRHRDWFEELARQARAEWIGPRQLEWADRLTREQPNLRDALEFCVSEPGQSGAGLVMAVALYQYWISRGLYGEAKSWLDRALACTDGHGPAERIPGLCANSVLAEMQGDIESARSQIEEMRGLVDKVDDPATKTLLDLGTGFLSMFSGDLPRAVDCFESALAGFRAEGDLLQQVEALFGLALARGVWGDPDRAIACQEEALAITASHGESMYRSYVMWTLGMALFQRRELARSTELIESGLRLTREVGDPLATSTCLETLAWIASDEDRAERAAVLMGAAVSVGEAAGNPTIVIRDLHGHHDRVWENAGQVLGPRAFEAAYRRGRDLDIDAAVAYALNDKAPATPRASEPGVRLTRREREVAELVGQGLTNKAIAQRLVIAQRTAEGHVENVLAKLGFTTRTQVAAWIVADDTGPAG